MLDSKAVRLLSSMNDLGDPPLDSYDKLVAWMAEMAEHENVDLDTQLFLRQVNRLAQRSRSKDSTSQSFRQNSASCESNTSSAAGSSTPAYTRSPHLHPLSALRGGRYTRASFGRQDTVSDDVDDRSAPDTANASVESLCNDSERDLDLSTMTLDEEGLSERKFSTISDALLQQSAEFQQKYSKPFSSSTSNILGIPDTFNGAKDDGRKRSLSSWDIPCFRGPPIQNVSEVDIPDSALDSCVLDDVLLDQNMADILFSVEALWPSRPK
ncbi:uncharacterized protein LOC135468442 [Liolophura sinensis]|uniref:uncharacterized protein LOC135468442 n=1 Tax=Liolophura sinensis TaxID=3198878 RepID=UPI003158B4C2